MSTDKGAPAKAPLNIHEYLAEFDDIPGTRVYTAARARKGYHINQFAMSLMKAENRARFKVICAPASPPGRNPDRRARRRRR